MIEAKLPDGTIAKFPDGTPHATIAAALRRSGSRLQVQTRLRSRLLLRGMKEITYQPAAAADRGLDRATPRNDRGCASDAAGAGSRSACGCGPDSGADSCCGE
jgi:hypothetical protein